MLVIANGLSFMLNLPTTTTQLNMDEYDKLTAHDNAESIVISNAKRGAVG
jgi:hypothetical protein